MWVTFGLVLGLLVLAAATPPGRASPGSSGASACSVLVILAQGAIGYIQYFTGVPAWLVLLHIAGSVVFWVAVLFVRFAVRERGVADQTRPSAHAA